MTTKHLTRVVQTGTNVTVRVAVALPQKAFDVVTCQVELGHGRIEQLLKNDQEISLRYKLPGTYVVGVFCNTFPTSHQLSSEIDLIAEAPLTVGSLNLSCIFCTAQQSVVYSVTVSFQHRYSHPISYALMFKNLEILTTYPVLQEMKFTNMDPERVDFYLSPDDQALLGPGVHPFSLLLHNHVSIVTFSANFTLTEPLRGLHIAADHYAGLHPEQFSIKVSLTFGAPANVTVSVSRQSDEEEVARKRTMCLTESECKQIVAKVSVPTAGELYELHASATNSLSSVSSNGVFVESVPQIYDVYVTTESGSFINELTVIMLFIRGDIGDYELTYEINGRLEENTIHLDGFDSNHLIDLPFDGKRFKLFEEPAVFHYTGLQRVPIALRNSKQTFRFVGEVFVRERKTCLQKVKINSGRYVSARHPLRIATRAVLNAETSISCVKSVISHKWQIFKVQSSIDLPKLENELTWPTDITIQEVVIGQSDFPPGLYTVTVSVVESDPVDNHFISRETDFTSIEIIERNADVIINGGSTREFGNML